MTRDSRRVARLLDQIRSRVGRLEGVVQRDESIPNILGITDDGATGSDEGSTSTGAAGAMVFDEDSFDGGTKWQ